MSRGPGTGDRGPVKAASGPVVASSAVETAVECSTATTVGTTVIPGPWSPVPGPAPSRSPVPGPEPESRIPHPESRLVALIAGEDSGDVLGADLAAALQRRLPGVRLIGVGGPRMRAAGVETWHDIAELSVMGLAEVLRHLPRLLRLRRQLAKRLAEARPDVVIGIDAPDFNLGLERRLKRIGMRTVHYVSPSVWAWREGRARKLGASTDRVLCLFPMEPPIYARHGIDARFVGHPQADRFPMQPDRAAARRELGLPADAPVLAVLPGSRGSEIERLGQVFLDAAARVAQTVPGLRIVVPAANARCRVVLEGMVASVPGPGTELGPGTDGGPGSSVSPPAVAVDHSTAGSPAEEATTAPDAAFTGPGSPVPGPPLPRSPVPGPPSVPGPIILSGHAELALTAADVALVASGTATLETLLAKTPMVVGYRIAPLTYRIVRAFGMMKTDYYSLPNFLAGQSLVSELMQDDCQADKLATALLDLFHDASKRKAMADEFIRLHQVLHGPLAGGKAADHAAQAIVELLAEARDDRA